VFEFLGAIGGIILVDLVLSGDNALVIGAAAAGLPRRQRWLAIVVGGGGAVVLRTGFAVIATFLLTLPLLQALGGLLLLAVAIHLLMGRPASGEVTAGKPAAHTGQHTGGSLLSAMLTILIADATMSLDNVIAVGALAHGDLLLLATGILLSLLILMFGSALVAELIGRLPWLLDLASLVLGWTAGHLIMSDLRVGPVLRQLPWMEVAVPAACLALVLLADVLLRQRVRQAS
jgi:YjbE family integral membrane protein